MRPEYEKLEDRQNQGIVAAEISQSWDMELWPLPKYAVCDFMIITPQMEFALGELKSRQGNFGHYPDLIVSQQKLDKVIAAAEALKLPFFLFVQWVDCIVYRRISRVDMLGFAVGRRGRADRGDAADIEMVYQIPTPSFQPISVAPL